MGGKVWDWARDHRDADGALVGHTLAVPQTRFTDTVDINAVFIYVMVA